MTKQSLLALADEAAIAKASEQRRLLWKAFCAIHNTSTGVAASIQDRFIRMLEAEAYESAAIALVGESVNHIEWCDGFVETAVFAGTKVLIARAATLALALTSASLRAVAETMA